MKPRARSYDVFDTCLVRTLARPADLFFLLGRRMLMLKGLPASRSLVAAAANVRLRAEQEARRRSTAQDLDIGAIYRVLPEVDVLGFDPETMMREELALERHHLRPVPGMAQCIDQWRRRGMRILFITDMYLPEDFLRERLAGHGLARPGDGVYVSGALGLTKHGGDLFRHVLKAEGLRPGELVHCGDNPQGDVRVPRSLGIRVEPHQAARLTPGEERLLGLDPSWAPELSAMAGASRLCRLHGREQGGHPALAETAAGVVAPVLGAFVSWVLATARERGWRRLYFVSRDGQILVRMARELAGGLGLDCRYLHGSRQAWFLAALDGFDLESAADWLFVPGHSLAPADVLRKLGIVPGDLAPAPGAPPPQDPFWTRQAAGEDLATLRALMGSEAFAVLVSRRAAQARGAAMAYFAQEGLLAGDPVVLVDIGWTLKAQKALRTCLELCGARVPVHGLYFGVQAAHAPRSELGAFDAYFVEQPRHFDPTQRLNAIFRNANCIEQVFTAADHGQAMGYRHTPEGVSSLPGPAPGERRLAVVRLTQETARRYAALLAEHAPWDWPHDRLRAWCGQLLMDFLSSPPAHQAAALAGLPVFDDQTESRSRPLARKIGMGELLALLFRKPRPRPGGYAAGFDWLEGSIALSSPLLRPILRRPSLFQRLRAYRMGQ